MPRYSTSLETRSLFKSLGAIKPSAGTATPLSFFRAYLLYNQLIAKEINRCFPIIDSMPFSNHYP